MLNLLGCLRTNKDDLEVVKDVTLLDELRNLMLYMKTMNIANMEKLCGNITKDENTRGHPSNTVSKVVMPAKDSNLDKAD